MTTATLLPTEFEFKSTLTGNLSIQEAEGIVEFFAAGIGNKDRTGDIIMPGAFAKTLKTIKPRVVWGHDWNHPIGKVLEIYEVGPDDPRLPDKMRESRTGGLYVKAQFNLKSEKGREAFTNVVFFGADQEYSIGYKTKVSKFDGRLQANLLEELDLFEVSPVLHGANFMTATISIKSADEDDDAVISRGLAMLKSVCDEDPEWAEAAEKAYLTSTEEKVGPGNAGAIQDAIGGDALQGHGPHRGGLGDLLRYWRPIMKKPGGFRRCLVILADHPELGPLPNLCAWLHHETTGKWPNEGNHSRRNRHTVENAVGKSMEDEFNANPATGQYASLAKAMHAHFGSTVTLRTADSNSVVYSRDDDEDTYRVKYTVADDEYLFGKPEKEECDCGGPCCDAEKSLEDQIGELQEKAGRVINSSNSEKIRQALTLLGEVLSSGGIEMETKNPVLSIKSGDEGLASALMIVGGFHGDESVYSDGSPMEVQIKSIEHQEAVTKVINALHGIVEGETK